MLYACSNVATSKNILLCKQFILQIASYLPATYKNVGSLLFSIAVVSNITITHLYSFLFLSSFITMFCTIRLLLITFALYPSSMPFIKDCTP